MNASRDDMSKGLGPCLLMTMVMLAGIMLSFLPMTFADPGSSAEGVVLTGLEDQRYSKTLDLEEKAHFLWVLENRNLTYSYDVDIRASAQAEKWDVRVENDNFRIGPDTSMLIEVIVSSDDGSSGDSTIVLVNVTLVEIGTGITSYRTATATVSLDFKVTSGVTILLWHFDLPSYLDNPWGRFIILLVIWSVLVYLLTVAIIDGIIRRAVGKTKTKADDIILDIIRTPIIVLLIGYGVINTLEVFGLPRSLMDEVQKWYVIIATFVVTYVIYKVIKDVLIYYGDLHARRTGSQTAKMLLPLINNLITVVIVVGAISFILSYLGYDVTMAVAGLGVMGLVIAFAAQDTLSNFFSGIHMLVDRPFQKGDLIILESGEWCEIRSIGFRSARLYNVSENVLITLPNNKLANSKIINITAPDYTYRLKLEVGVAYGTDIKLVRDTLLEVARAHKDVMQDEKHGPSVRFRKFGESQLDIQLYIMIEDIRKEDFFIMGRVRSELNEAIDRAFKEKRIKIPFPQRELWMSSMPGKG